MKDSHETDIAWIKENIRDMKQSSTDSNKKMDEGFRQVHVSLQELRDLYLDTFETKQDAHKEHGRLEEMIKDKADKEDVVALKDNQRWLARLIVGTFVTALLGLIIYGTKPF